MSLVTDLQYVHRDREESKMTFKGISRVKIVEATEDLPNIHRNKEKTRKMTNFEKF